MYGRLSVAALFEKIGDYDEAIKRYESALKKYPTSAEAMQRLKALYQRTGRSDDLERLRRRLAEQGLQL
jgi:tetratricopeptide (TPR) repeat protein